MKLSQALPGILQLNLDLSGLKLEESTELNPDGISIHRLPNSAFSNRNQGGKTFSFSGLKIFQIILQIRLAELVFSASLNLVN